MLLACADFYHDIFGGITRVMFELGTRMAERGHEVFHLARRVRADQPDREDVDGMHVVRYDFSNRGLIRFHSSEIRNAGRAARAVYDEAPIDLLHIHQTLPGLGALADRPRSAAVVYTFHAPWATEWLDSFDFTKPQARGLRHAGSHVIAAYLAWQERRCLRRSDAVHVLSQFTRSKAQQLYAVPEEKLHLVPGGVDLTEFDASLPRAEARSRLELPTDRFVVLTVRRLVERMGLENLIETARQMRSDMPDLLLLIVGEGHLRPRLEEQIGERSLHDAVRLVGTVPESDLRLYYRAADVFALPTRELEGFGMATLEAMACGTPVLGTPVGGTVELLRGLDPALLFADTSPGAMAAKILQFARATEWRERLPKACRAYVEERYSWEAVVSRFEQLCLDLRARKGASQ